MHQHITSFSHEQYEPIEELGRGGMGVVYKCRDRKLLKDVAVKVIGWNLCNDEVIRFHKEAKALARLQHPNILAILHFGHSDDDSLFLVMELLSGNSLSSLIRNEELLSFEDALTIFIQLCDGLAHAHRKDILHRDIKPSNVYIERTAGGDIKATVTDFGLAKLLTEDQHLTKTGISVGTPAYMSPEQADGKTVDERSDLYSLGCLMFEVLVGQKLFEAPTIPALLMMHVNDSPPRLSDRAPDRNYPEEMERVIAKCLKKKPEERYRSVSELSDDLKRTKDWLAPTFAQIESSGSYSPSQLFLKSGAYVRTGLQNIARSSRSGRIVVALLVIGVVAIAGFFAYVFFLEKAPEVTNVNIETEKPLLRADDDTDEVLNDKLDSMAARVPEKDKDWKKIHGTGAGARLSALVNSTNSSMETSGSWPDYFDLSNSDITDAELSTIASIPFLGIRLNDTKVGDAAANMLSNVGSLREISLDRTKITDEGVKQFAKNTSLTCLSLNGTDVTDATISEMGNFRHLNWVSINQCPKISGETLGALQKLDDLFLLSIGRSGINRENLTQLAGSRVKFLDLSGLDLTDQDLQTVTTMPQLQTLLIDENPKITAEGFLKLARMKTLLIVHIMGCEGIPASAVAQFEKLHGRPKTVIVTQSK